MLFHQIPGILCVAKPAGTILREMRPYARQTDMQGASSMENRVYYYARVSTKEQNLDRQIAAFVAMGPRSEKS